MSEQEPKPPNPDVLTHPPPVVNPPSSRSEKNLKTKKTTRTMNPKPANTMKHHDMLSKSTDVNFKKVITRSSSKGSDTGMGVKEMEYEEESNEVMAEKVVVADTGEAGKSMNGDISDEIRVEEVLVTNASENVAVNKVDGKKDVSGDVVNGNVSDMFPELSSVNLNKKSSNRIDIMPDIPVPVELNPVLNPKLNSGGSSRDNCNGKNVSKDGAVGKEERVSGDNTEVQGTSGSKDEEMQDKNRARKPLLFSNVVQGANYKVWYRSLNRSMKLRVEYAWQPPICSHCCVFGHNLDKCIHRVTNEVKNDDKKENNMQNNGKNNGMQKEEGEWKTVPERKTVKSNNEPVVPQVHTYNSYGGGYARGGMYMGDDGDGNLNEWQGVIINIDVACEMGIQFDEEEMLKWPQNLKDYYKVMYDTMKKSDKRDLLLNKIKILENDIFNSQNNIEVNSQLKAKEGVAFEMESTGSTRKQAFELHLNPVHTVVQLRPSMKHLQDLSKKSNTARDEEEQAIKQNSKKQSKLPGPVNELNVDAKEQWISLEYHGETSRLSRGYLENMVAQQASQIQFNMSPSEYIDSFCPATADKFKPKGPSRRTVYSSRPPAVHDAMLEDVCHPAEIVGKRVRYRLDGSKIIKIYLDPKARNDTEYKLETFSGVYRKLSGKDVVFEYPMTEA
ncbi:ribosomal protein S7e [Artemisia annua]|uniref:Ribosomal protein S7e n=2 Tax=Artemisia annua TaxID=35608 RepID=A0A2U1MJ74_ARTAN|nr:ribosomal protein S7e [Artemisia annua]